MHLYNEYCILVVVSVFITTVGAGNVPIVALLLVFTCAKWHRVQQLLELLSIPMDVFAIDDDLYAYST